MARAQSYPSHPVRFLVGFPPNGPNSILAGIAGQWLAARLGQPFAIEHRPGQSGNIATAEAVRAPADGYTLLLCGPANAIGASLYPNLPYNFLRDMTPVAGITREALVLVVHPQLPVTSAGELIARARADSSAVKIASTGAGSAPHVTAELFKQMTGLKLEMVHYAGGGPALNAVASGEAQMMFEPMSAAIVPVHSGKLRALAVTTAGHRGPCRGFRRWPRRCRATRQARSRASQCRRTHRTPWSKTSTAPCSLRSAIPASKPGLPRPAASRCQARPPRSPR
jgi:tripartite-type tricarboxylate transporter receptor subunit TctC